MKNLLILHGSYVNPNKNWYKYIAKQAKEKGYEVHIPQLPHADKLNLLEVYNFLLDKKYINNETVVIGHSSGATLILGILQRLETDIKIKKAILVAGLVDAHLTDELFKAVPKSHYDNLFPKNWDWEKIKKSCREFVVFHSPTDPYVQMRHAETLKDKLNAKLIIVPDGSHFSVSTGGERYREFPQLVEYL